MEELIYAILSKNNTTNHIRSNNCQNINITQVLNAANRVYTKTSIQRQIVNGNNTFYISVDTKKLNTDITLTCKEF